MIAIYFVVAAFLYWPFRRWIATSEAPGISALLWPLMVLLFVGVFIFSPFIKNKY